MVIYIALLTINQCILVKLESLQLQLHTILPVEVEKTIFHSDWNAI